MGYRTRIDELRRKRAVELNKDITYQEIARATGLNYMTIHRYATKVVPNPHFATLAKIAQYFEIPVEQLVIPEDEDTEQGQKVAVAATIP
jgi:transcriptional regulator with XRE-family HTH domain